MSGSPFREDDWSPPQFSILTIMAVTVFAAPCFLAFRYGGFAAALRTFIVMGSLYTVVCFVRLLRRGQSRSHPNRFVAASQLSEETEEPEA